MMHETERTITDVINDHFPEDLRWKMLECFKEKKDEPVRVSEGSLLLGLAREALRKAVATTDQKLACAGKEVFNKAKAQGMNTDLAQQELYWSVRLNFGIML